MKNYIQIALLTTVIVASSACQNEDTITFSVKNTLDIARNFETVELHKKDFTTVADTLLKDMLVYDLELKDTLVTQHVDLDQDNIIDLLLFQPEIGPKQSKRFKLVRSKGAVAYEKVCYSRFVPERTDDYAWENDKVAFRTFGPGAQRMVEENIPGGTLSSGIDCWLKKVPYSIIDKWYAKNIDSPGSYHIDHGEGLDNFHVGGSRGCGGVASIVEGEVFVSKNFSAYLPICNGPIRTSFMLSYDEWNDGAKKITENKIITLDKGSCLMRIDEELGAESALSAGLTLHENDGTVSADSTLGIYSYWQPHADAKLGTAIVALPGNIRSHSVYESIEPDQSHLWVHFKESNLLTYYSGFYWTKSDAFNSKEEWETYLKDFSNKIANPLEVSF